MVKKQTTNTSESYKLQGLDSGLQVLEVFSASTPELSLADISLRLGLHRSVVFRALRTLASRQYVEQDPDTKKYRLGLAALRLGCLSADQLGIGTRMRAVLKSTADQSGETVTCAVLDGRQALLVGRALSSHDLRPNVRIGDRRPLHCTALGKVILAALSEPKLCDVLSAGSLERYTAKTICDRESLGRELEQVRLQGYAWSKEEYVEGLTCVAALVPRSAERHPMAVSIAVPSARCHPDHEGKLQVLVIEASRQIGSLTGHFESLGETAQWDNGQAGFVL